MQRHLYMQSFPYTGNKLCGQDGVSPQLEEVVVDAYICKIKHLSPETC
jgi:hypothetical protein